MENNILDPATLQQNNAGGSSSEFTGNPQTQPAQPTPAGVTNGVQVQTPVNPTPGPDRAFAQMRQELERYKSIAEDEGVRQFIAQREAAEAARKAETLGVNPQLLAELEQMKAFQAQQQQIQFANALAENEASTKGRFGMSDEHFNAFTDYVAANFKEVPEMLQRNPRMDLSPYIAAWNPSVYASVVAGQPQPQPQARVAYVPGHGIGAGGAIAQDEQILRDRIAAIASKGLNIKK